MSYEYPYEDDDFMPVGLTKEDIAQRRDDGVTHGSRQMNEANDGKLYRVRIDTDWAPGSYSYNRDVPHTSEVLGPYATPAIVKGIRTSNLPRNGRGFPAGILDRKVTIQETVTVWQDTEL